MTNLFENFRAYRASRGDETCYEPLQQEIISKEELKRMKVSEYNRKYYQSHKEKFKEYNKNYRAKRKQKQEVKQEIVPVVKVVESNFLEEIVNSVNGGLIQQNKDLWEENQRLKEKLKRIEESFKEYDTVRKEYNEKWIPIYNVLSSSIKDE